MIVDPHHTRGLGARVEEVGVVGLVKLLDPITWFTFIIIIRPYGHVTGGRRQRLVDHLTLRVCPCPWLRRVSHMSYFCSWDCIWLWFVCQASYWDKSRPTGGFYFRLEEDKESINPPSLPFQALIAAPFLKMTTSLMFHFFFLFNMV